MRPCAVFALAFTVLSCGGPKGPVDPVVHAGSGSAAATGSGDTTGPVDPGPPVTTGTSEVIAADSVRATPAGVAYTAPAGWTLTAGGSITILAAQDGDAWVAVVDATAADADAAVAEAWRLFRKSGTAPPLKLSADAPAREGWDEVRQYEYELPPNDKRAAFAGALRHGTAWTVLLVDASDATLGKRGAQFGLLLESIRPGGYARESFAGKTANKLDAARLAKLDDMIEAGRSELGIPGVAVAIIQDGKVIHAKGYGVRELGKKPAVDANTLFLIASNTKALTTLLLAELVDDGKLAWDQKVTEVYPTFKLGDAATTASTEVKHLVCACTGLPRKDLEWLFEFGKATALTELGYLADVQPTTKFGETFQYSNLLAGAAGYVAAHVVSPKLELGKAYDAAMKARVFGPLGMKSTTFDFAKALRGDHAVGHAWDIDGKPAVALMAINYSAVPIRPAGGAWSSVNDMIKYVQLELDKGVAPGGKRLVSEANLMQRRVANVALGEDQVYGMGLMVDTSRGVAVVHHGGSLIGFKSDMLWLPDHAVGAVILTNSDLGQAMLGPFQRYLLELLFDGKPEAVEDVKSSATTNHAAVAEERTHLTVPPDPDAVAALAAHYANDALGRLDVVTKKGVTMFDLGEWKTAVASRKNDDGTLSFVSTTPGIAGFTWVVGTATDGTHTLIVRDAQHEYVFAETK